MKNLLKKDPAKGSSVYKSFNFINGVLLLQNGEEILLEHRLKLLFSALLAQQDNFVTRSELIDEVWNDVVVDDQSLTKAVSDLRKLIAKHKIKNIHIVTANKLGYKMIVSQSTDKNPNFSKIELPIRVFGYAALTLMILIIMIRAARY